MSRTPSFEPPSTSKIVPPSTSKKAPATSKKAPATMSTTDLMKIRVTYQNDKVLTMCQEIGTVYDPTLTEVEDAAIGILMNQALQYVTKSNILSPSTKEILVNKMSNRLYTLTIYHEHDEISITEGTILHKLIKDLMSKSQPVMLTYNVSNDKAVVKTKRTKVKTTSTHSSTSSVSSDETEETPTPAESSKASDSSDSSSISSGNKSESSTESNTFTSPKMDEKGWKKYWKSMDTKIDLKNLLKVEGLELKSRDHIDLWYQQLHEHAFNHGVFIPPYPTAKKNQIMGSIWTDKIIPKEIKANRRQMSSTVHRLLNVSGFIADSMAEIKDAILPAAGNGYRALYNVLRLFHPKLQDTEYQQSAPKQKQNETFGTFINRFRGYFMRER